MAFRLFPGLFSKIGIFRDEIEFIFQRPLSFLFPGHTGAGEDVGRVFQYYRLFSEAFDHAVGPLCIVSISMPGKYKNNRRSMRCGGVSNQIVS